MEGLGFELIHYQVEVCHNNQTYVPSLFGYSQDVIKIHKK